MNATTKTETKQDGIILLNASESAQAERLLADKGLDCLHAWEPGCYRAVDADGEDMGMVMCSQNTATVVNRCINAR